MIWNEAKECMSRDEMSVLQGKRLVKTVNRVYHNVPFYRKKMQELGLEPGDIRGIEDLSKLPFTTKDDLRENYPLQLAAAPREELVRIHASSGTTGKPIVVPYTRKDLDMWNECVARILSMVNVGRRDVVQVSYGYGLFTGGLGAHGGAENIGALVVPTSSGNTKRQMMMLVDMGVTCLCCTPSYLMHLTETLEEEGLIDQLKLRCAFCGAEPWTEEMRKEINRRLRIDTHDIYGLTEIVGPGVAGDCEFHKGLHICEDNFLPEILDPVTKQQLGGGEQGELVFTTITKEGMPFLRYRTKDLTSIDYSPCECGRTTARLNRFKGRTDDMLIIRGVNVFPSQVETALLEMGEASPNYMIIVDRVDNQDTFQVQVEVDERFFSDSIKEYDGLKKRIAHVLRQALGLAVDVKLVEPKTIQRSEGKAKRVIDKRKLV